jgi:hypothetical protein
MKINVQLTADQIEHIGAFLRSEITSNIRGVDYDSAPEAIIEAWRNQRREFVADARANDLISKSRNEASELLDVLDTDAEILELLSTAVDRQEAGVAFVPLKTDDLECFCQDMASELRDDMPGGTDIDEDDFPAVLKAWREHSPRYVQDRLESQAVQKARGFLDYCCTANDLEEARAMHDETADRLARLLPHFETAEVHHV